MKVFSAIGNAMKHLFQPVAEAKEEQHAQAKKGDKPAAPAMPTKDTISDAGKKPQGEKPKNQ